MPGERNGKRTGTRSSTAASGAGGDRNIQTSWIDDDIWKVFSLPNKSRLIFSDTAIQEQFDSQGFVVLPFYDDQAIEKLQRHHDENHPQNERGFYPSTFSNDSQYRVDSDAFIRKVASRPIAEYFRDSQTVFGAYIVKWPGPESGMCLHQDMSLVDESEFVGANIWVPLVDLNIDNGLLYVIPGSHRFLPTYRGSSIPEFFANDMDALFDYLIPVPVKAGEAVVFNQSILHFSPPNLSSKPRVVTNIYITHLETRFRTYYWESSYGHQVEEFEQSAEFMRDFEQFGVNIRQRPQVGNSLGMQPYHFPNLDWKEWDDRFPKTLARKLIKLGQGGKLGRCWGQWLLSRGKYA